jgi:hypothetical protein
LVGRSARNRPRNRQPKPTRFQFSNVCQEGRRGIGAPQPIQEDPWVTTGSPKVAVLVDATLGWGFAG